MKDSKNTKTDPASAVLDAPVDTCTETTDTTVAVENRVAVAELLVDKYAKWSFGSGFIPAPAIDLLVLTGLQMKMLHQIAKVYDLKYTDNTVRSTLGALIGGSMPQTVGKFGLSSFLKSIPVLGTVAALATMPIISAASTFAIGSVFIKHFESGGTFLNVNFSSMKTDIGEVADKYRKKNQSSEVQAA